MEDSKTSAGDVAEVISNSINHGEIAEYFSGEHKLAIETRSFEDAGVLTNDEGFIVYVDGREFQVTIVRSK